MTPQPIETRYAGCRFRSRLEARWAVFFDTLDVPWEYEPQGFHVGPKRRPYLPDFRITRPTTSQALWVEVKGSDDTLDLQLLGEAASSDNGIGAPIAILGPIPEPTPPPMHAFVRDIFGTPCMVRGLLGPGMGVLQIGREHALDSPLIPKNPVTGPITSRAWVVTEILDQPKVSAAYVAARSARFEHGESPR